MTKQELKNQLKILIIERDWLEEQKRWRCKGHSTAIAFDTLAKAMKQTNRWIKIEDHAAGAQTDHHLKMMIMDIIKTLKFDHFEFSKEKNCVRFTGLVKKNMDDYFDKGISQVQNKIIALREKLSSKPSNS